MKKKNMLFLLPLLLLTACEGTSSSLPSSPSSSVGESSTSSSTEDSSLVSSSEDSSQGSSLSSSLDSSSSSSSVEEEIDLGESLAAFSQGYKMEATVLQDVNGRRSRYITRTQVKNDKITFVVYQTVAEDETPSTDLYSLFETYVLDSKTGRALSTRRDISNKANTYTVYNPLTSEPYLFVEDGYRNIFLELSEADFEKSEAGYTYLLEDETKTSHLSNQLYGNPGMVLSSFSIVPEKDGTLSFTATLTFTSSATEYRYDYEGTFAPLGDNEEILERAKPYDPVEDEKFTTALERLRQNDYTVTVTNLSDGQESVSTYMTNADGIRYKTQEGEMTYDMYYYVTEEGDVQECQKVGDSFIRLGDPMEGSLDELRPSLAVDRACLNATGENTYAIREDVEGDMANFTILYAEASELSDFTITLGEDTITMENIYGKTKTTLVFSNIGSTQLGITPEEVQEPSTDVALKDLLEESSLEFLSTIMSEEDINALPAPEGFADSMWVNLAEGEPLLMLVYNGEQAFSQEDIDAYVEKILSLGYTEREESLNEGGLAYNKTSMVNGEEKTVYLEVLDYDGFFTIVIMDEALTSEM